jgi:hypothetical protein
MKYSRRVKEMFGLLSFGNYQGKVVESHPLIEYEGMG